MTVVIVAARRTTFGLSLLLFCAALGAELVRAPSMTRYIAAACFGLCGVAAAAQWPRATVVGLLILLPFLALGRRLLLEFAPWKSTDPLLLLAPALIGLVLLGLFFVERRAVAPDRLSKLILFLCGLMLLEAFNPRGGGLRAGVAALLFTVVPLLWFFVGRELATPRAIRTICLAIVPIASAVAVYGLLQTFNGLPSWDAMWVQQAGYTALDVGGVIRAFGTFSSSAEYATYLSIAIVVALAFAFTRRPYLLPAVPLLVVALFYESSRGPFVTTILATLVVLAARTGSMRRAVLTLVVCLVGVVVALTYARSSIQQTAATSSNPLTAHLLGGFAHPLNNQQSTLTAHFTLLRDGLKSGVLNPVGDGIASTTLAGSTFGNGSSSSEVDLSNMFISCGTLGGFAYLAILLLAMRLALRQAVNRRDTASLAALGILAVTFGAWLNGGFYAVSALAWFTVGYLIANERELVRPDMSSWPR